MSIWTHAQGVLRISGLERSEKRINEIKEILDKDIPTGSEGSLKYEILENQNKSDFNSYNVMIFGDLRDFHIIDPIYDWFVYLIENLKIREANLHVDCEFEEDIALFYLAGNGKSLVPKKTFVKKYLDKKEKQYVITEPTGSYFLDPSYESWNFTKDIEEATKFNSLEEAEEMKDILDKAVCRTYWDSDDIVPFPTIKKVEA